MRTRILIALAAMASLSLLWGCGDDEDTSGAAGSTATGGAAGQAGSASGGAAGEAGAAGAANGGSAGEAGAAGTAGAAGAAACGTSPVSHTDCMTAGGTSAGHLPGKEKARSTCNTCHEADLGKSAKTDCWSCHDPASQTNLHNMKIGNATHKKATSGGKGATNPECSACHLDNDSLGGNTCGTCH